ncbi:MAG: MraY family glycosyltransferase [Corynebacterium sp.]|uniref:glycosyltransferase family 4 protein n=1 Tax=Corynebacterium sp. TaxID=1720 RepID=UPI0026DC7D47|nr:MraY family glycosyltransferase [Corynebacterium sp.]MDO5029407.1 MraY family glycosyltransferase [Corynebacterium sp.]
MTSILAAQSGGAGVPIRELAMLVLVAAAVSYLLTGVVRYVLVRSGWLDQPRLRDVHDIPKPRLGGVAMYSGVLAAVALASVMPALNRGFPPMTPDMRAIVVAASVLLVVGIWDDLFDLDAITKLIGQIAAALLMSFMGVNWYLLYIPFGGGSTLILDPIMSTVFTVLFTVALINAFNFVDGIDGLAAGLGMIAAGAILVYSMVMLHDQGGTVSAYPPAMISACLFGACLGFLPHNFEPARIFMGDSGAMMIGLLLAGASVSASGRIAPSMYGTADVIALMSPILVVIAAISVPMLDLLLAVIRRVSQGKSPFSPDKMHIHHRLLSMGHSHRRVVLVLYLWVSVVAYAAVATTVFPSEFVAITFGLLLIVAVIFTVRRRNSLNDGASSGKQPGNSGGSRQARRQRHGGRRYNLRP